MRLNEIVKKDFEPREGVSPVILNHVQRENNLVFPSDLVYLYLNSDGLKLKPGYEITLDKKEALVEMSDILDLEWIIKERQYDWEDDSAKGYIDGYLKIANTFSQDRVLIGIKEDNWNKVYLYLYDEDELLRVCDSLFDFINDHLI